MRLFFLMLLLLNGIFFAVNALREPEMAKDKNITNSDIPQLVLLDEKINLTKKSSTIKNTPKKITKTPSKEPVKEATVDLKTWLAKFTAENFLKGTQKTQTKQQNFCYTAGPFQTTDNLQQATDFFTSINIQTQQRSIVENHYIGMLVYLPGQSSRKAIIKTAKKLAQQGVKDYMLLNEPGKQNSLSLGVYGLKKNAEQRIETLSKLDYKAKSEARYRKKTVYWLDYAFSVSDAQTERSAQHMNSLSVSQIERNCKS